MVVLPCGAGKTIVGAAAMARAQATTLILVTNTVSARQWRDELIKRTSLTAEEIGEYSGAKKEIRPVTIATYQVITTKRGGVHPHLELFDARDWGLIIYDEVHLLPAPVFRMTADLQARRRLGLTATLVREDGREGDVFSLIGPKRFDAPWKDIEAQGYIAPADCIEVRVTLTEPERMTYAVAEADVKYRLAATADSKTDVVVDLVAKHRGTPTLVIGQYVDQLDELAERLDAPLIKGDTTVRQREKLYEAFRTGEIDLLVVSKVANFSIDLPTAQVAIQVSGAFGSRQEEAQRLGRLLRPKADGVTARFYAVVSRDTVDAEFAAHRQRFLAEQGYALPHHGRRGRPRRRVISAYAGTIVGGVLHGRDHQAAQAPDRQAGRTAAPQEIARDWVGGSRRRTPTVAPASANRGGPTLASRRLVALPEPEPQYLDLAR